MTATATHDDQMKSHPPAREAMAQALPQSSAAERMFRERVRKFAAQDRLFAWVTFSFAALVLFAMAAMLVALRGSPSTSGNRISRARYDRSTRLRAIVQT